ncbi:MAG: iron-containing alcohol dehydrogenase [Chloroflexi bacterium]|nr:MAG: iron-containing alcohol dehydrogenase [Chloroflexota bacterium]
MWFFKAPEFFFGEDALSQLEELSGKRAFIVTDVNIQQLGFVDVVQQHLHEAGMETAVFPHVEPDPSLQTVRRGANAMNDFEPDWIIGLGGGSCMDAAKAMWIVYERPDIDPAAISPLEDLGLRKKARLICIPTTSGTGSESNYAIILTDTEAQRKLTLGSREATPDIAIVDPYFTMKLPAQITANTGIDVLSHAIEAFSCTWANDFTDGLCLKAAKMVFGYLPRAVANGGDDDEAREKMANAASIAGIVLGNSQVALAHAMGHSAGAVFKTVPHGRITAVFLPYTIEFVGNSGMGRYEDLARYLGLGVNGESNAAQKLADAVRELMQMVNLPTSLEETGIDKLLLDQHLEMLVEHVEMDTSTMMSRRIPETEEVEKLFSYAYDGRSIDF